MEAARHDRERSRAASPGFDDNADILDGTPLLDIKPFAPEFDHHDAESTGWLAAAGKKIRDMKSDNRFG